MRPISLETLEKEVKGKSVLVDTNVIIYLTDDIHPYAPLSRRLFEMIESGDVFACFSIISIAEVMQGPLRKGQRRTAIEVRDYLLNFPNSICQEINLNVLEQVGVYKQIDWVKLRAADSLIIASGLVNDVGRIVSNDNHFKKAVPPNLLLPFKT